MIDLALLFRQRGIDVGFHKAQVGSLLLEDCGIVSQLAEDESVGK